MTRLPQPHRNDLWCETNRVSWQRAGQQGCMMITFFWFYLFIYLNWVWGSRERALLLIALALCSWKGLNQSAPLVGQLWALMQGWLPVPQQQKGCWGPADSEPPCCTSARWMWWMAVWIALRCCPSQNPGFLSGSLPPSQWGIGARWCCTPACLCVAVLLIPPWDVPAAWSQ